MASRLKALPPYSGIRLSTTVTSAPRPTRRRARLEPMKPRPPVMSARRPANQAKRGSSVTAQTLIRSGSRIGEPPRGPECQALTDLQFAAIDHHREQRIQPLDPVDL